MASRRQQPRKTADLPAAADPLVAGAEDVASENLLIFQLAGRIVRVAACLHRRNHPAAGSGPYAAGAAEPARSGQFARDCLACRSACGRCCICRTLKANEQTRVIVMRGDAAVGFVVDRVDRLMALAAHQLEHDDAGAGTIDPALLDGVIKGAEGQSTIKLLNPSRLLSGQFTRLGVSDDAALRTGRRSPSAVRPRRRPRR